MLNKTAKTVFTIASTWLFAAVKAAQEAENAQSSQSPQRSAEDPFQIIMLATLGLTTLLVLRYTTPTLTPDQLREQHVRFFVRRGGMRCGCNACPICNGTDNINVANDPTPPPTSTDSLYSAGAGEDEVSWAAVPRP